MPPIEQSKSSCALAQPLTGTLLQGTDKLSANARTKILLCTGLFTMYRLSALDSALTTIDVEPVTLPRQKTETGC
jgi:hypothetical protein